MKYLQLLIVSFFIVACCDSKEIPSYYIIPEIEQIVADYSGDYKRIAISSNCAWTIQSTPQWCVVKKVSVDNSTSYLDIEITPNQTGISRQTTILLSGPYNNQNEKTSAQIYIFQSGQEQTEESLNWYTFAVNKFNNIEYEILPDNITRRYNINAEYAFVNPTYRSQIYPGHLINCHIKDYNLIVYDQYSYNPITISSYINGQYFKEEIYPSLEALNKIVQEIVPEIPKLNAHFNYSGPHEYYSHKHLRLLSFGNLGFNFDELIYGVPYTKKEMEKRTGFFYNFSWNMFSIMMDYPNKLIQETIDEEQLMDMRYITHISFGRTSFLFVETNRDYTEARQVVDKLLKKENLGPNDDQIKNDLLFYYIYVDNKNLPQIIKGGDELARRFTDEINSLDVIPLTFTTNKLSNHAIGNIDIEFQIQ